jgi:hypothetical protein
VRTVAPLELRAQRLAAAEGLELDQARQLATVVDRQRRAYVAHVFGADWSSPLNYDLLLNLGRLSLDQAASTILDLATHPEFQPAEETTAILGDMVVAGRVRRQLVEEVDVHALEVDCQHGRVSVSGYVASQEEMNRALELARSAEGVEELDHGLEVSPALMRFLP